MSFNYGNNGRETRLVKETGTLPELVSSDPPTSVRPLSRLLDSPGSVRPKHLEQSLRPKLGFLSPSDTHLRLDSLLLIYHRTGRVKVLRPNENRPSVFVSFLSPLLLFCYSDYISSSTHNKMCKPIRWTNVLRQETRKISDVPPIEYRCPLRVDGTVVK